MAVTFNNKSMEYEKYQELKSQRDNLKMMFQIFPKTVKEIIIETLELEEQLYEYIGINDQKEGQTLEYTLTKIGKNLKYKNNKKVLKEIENEMSKDKDVKEFYEMLKCFNNMSAYDCKIIIE